MAARAPVPVSGGLSPADTADRLGTARLVLAELVHATAGRLAREPRFEDKAALASHLYDDARSVARLDRRLAELPQTSPHTAAGELAATLDRLPGEPELAYTVLKPALLAYVRATLRELEPAVDEATLRVLTKIGHRQDRHIAEQTDRPSQAPPALETVPGTPRPPLATPLPEQPARDAFVEIGEPGDGGLHDLVHAKLCGAELAAHASHERPDAPWEMHLDMARIAADLLRHAAVADRLSHGAWGTHPVAPGYVTDSNVPPHLPIPAAVLDHLRADEAVHTRLRQRWA